MSNGTTHIATIAAYELQDGGFRGVFFLRATKERRASDRFETFEQATYWAKKQAHEAYDATGYSLAPLRKRGEYQANVWVAA